MSRLQMVASLVLTFVLSSSQAIAEAEKTEQVRFATFNVAMGLEEEGELARRLANGNDGNLKKLAEVLQRLRPDVILLNEWDYQEGVDTVTPLNEHYLNISQRGWEPIDYPYHFVAPVNTGVDSGADLNENGVKGEPADRKGFGHFPGQYGMILLSRYPIDHEAARTFQNFAWNDMHEPTRPGTEDGQLFYQEENWLAIPLSSKSHWDVPVVINDHQTVHVLASHPTPPVFDGPEDRNGSRNKDEIRFWRDYLWPGLGDYIVDDKGLSGGKATPGHWIIAGDLNADPKDGDVVSGGIHLFMDNPQVNWSCIPASTGAVEAAKQQGGVNQQHTGLPQHDTADFNDKYTGNLRVDYLITSTNTTVKDCGVYWPAKGEDGHDLIDLSDHRLVWMDLQL